MTEVEELGRVATPTRRGHPEVAVANIGGTVLHFLSLNAGILAVVRPLPLDDATTRIHLPAAVLSPVILTATVATGAGISRRAGVFLLVLYVAYIGASIAYAFGRGWW